MWRQQLCLSEKRTWANYHLQYIKAPYIWVLIRSMMIVTFLMVIYLWTLCMTRYLVGSVNCIPAALNMFCSHHDKMPIGHLGYGSSYRLSLAVKVLAHQIIISCLRSMLIFSIIHSMQRWFPSILRYNYIIRLSECKQKDCHYD